MLSLIGDLLTLYLLVLLAYSILSWLTYSGRLDYDSPVIKVQKILAAVCEPLMGEWLDRCDPQSDQG